MDDVLSSLGQRIAAVRRARNIAQYKLAKDVGISKKTLTWIETGHTSDPKSSIVLRLAQALNVSTDWLLGRSPHD